MGAEMKAIAYDESNIMLRLVIMEGKERQAQKPFADIGSEGTAITLRLCSPYFDSGRVIHADSAFSSVRTCLKLRSVPADTHRIEGDILSVNTAASNGENLPREYSSKQYGLLVQSIGIRRCSLDRG